MRLRKRTINPEALWIAIGRDCREFALLWLVFSILDRLVNDRLTVTWLFANSISSLVIWIIGSYIELSRSEKTK